MARRRYSRWAYKEREIMRLSESIFVSSLNLKWIWKGTSFELHKDGVMIWTSLVGAEPWDYPTANAMAKFLLEYLNTPVADLRARAIDHIRWDGWSNYDLCKDNFTVLRELMLAADRRIGKNLQSLRLFVEPDIRVRNIIGARL